MAYHLIRACYIAMPLYLCGFLVLGASFQEKLSVGALVMGWGLAEVAVMINTVAVCKWLKLVPSVILCMLIGLHDRRIL